MLRFKIHPQVLGGEGPIPGIALKPQLFVRELEDITVSPDGKSLMEIKRVVLEFFWKLEPRTKYRFLFTDFGHDVHSERIEDNSYNSNPRWMGAQIVNPFDPPRPHWPVVIPIDEAEPKQ